MRDLGIFTSKPVSSQELVNFLRSYSSAIGQAFEKRAQESFLGNQPDVVYIADSTEAKQGYFSDEEKVAVEKELGSALQSYISLHFTSSDAAAALALRTAREIAQMWTGIIDYSGAGGGLGVAPVKRATGDAKR